MPVSVLAGREPAIFSHMSDVRVDTFFYLSFLSVCNSMQWGSPSGVKSYT